MYVSESSPNGGQQGEGGSSEGLTVAEPVNEMKQGEVGLKQVPGMVLWFPLTVHAGGGRAVMTVGQHYGCGCWTRGLQKPKQTVSVCLKSNCR